MFCRKFLFILAVLTAGIVCGGVAVGNAGERRIKEKECFYLRSLHYTANGMEYWYSKENGGLERLTGIPYDQLGCKNCHAAGCDRCHKSVETRKNCQIAHYQTDAARRQDMCLECHGREKAVLRIDRKARQADVHASQGMICTDCHSAVEIHGDGTEFLSMKQPGAMTTQCQDCHDDLSHIEAHTVHGQRLDCKACHVRHVVSCTNCHFDTMVEKGVRKALPVSGWVFLINRNDRVTSASMQTFVTKGDNTFLMFAPHMSHSIMKEGRACDSCHGSDNVVEAGKGAVRLTWLEDGRLVNQKGVIPVLDDVDYPCVYQNFKDGKWIPIKNPAEPLRQYVAFGEPLTKEQFKKLLQKQEAPLPKME